MCIISKEDSFYKVTLVEDEINCHYCRTRKDLDTFLEGLNEEDIIFDQVSFGLTM